MIGFGEAVRNGFQRALDVRGRASRAEYWWWALFNAVVTNVISLLLGADSGLAVLLVLGLLVPSVTVLVRRLHDSGRSGWTALVGFIPAVGVLILLYFLVRPGQPESNRFGPPRLPDGATAGWAPPSDGGTWRQRWDGGDPGPQAGTGPQADPGGIGERGWDDLPPPPPPAAPGR